jgi:hypothetical protein
VSAPAPIPPPSSDRESWNEAYDRLFHFLRAFKLTDHAHVSQTALNLFHDAQKAHAKDPSRDPVTHTMEQAQTHLAEWLAINLGEENRAPAHILSTGYTALLLSQVYRTSPASFLANPVPEELRQALRETLIVAGPDLNVSSMTPRHLDFGPMLQLARQTWHRWNAKEIIVAFVFWTSVYFFFYWWISQLL